MREIQRIAEVANVAYQEFMATNPDREVRDLVSNAVKFLTVDLSTAGEFAATRPRKVA
ncbi:hypothetical protein GCM10027436_68420 [Actinophytocola sediminis]